MKKEDFDKIAAGLVEVKSFLTGEEVPGVVVHIPANIDVVAIRKKAALSQGSFAKEVGVSIGTLRNWEQGRRVPDGPARVLLAMLNKNPRIVAETLGQLEVV